MVGDFGGSRQLAGKPRVIRVHYDLGSGKRGIRFLPWILRENSAEIAWKGWHAKKRHRKPEPRGMVGPYGQPDELAAAW